MAEIFRAKQELKRAEEIRKEKARIRGPETQRVKDLISEAERLLDEMLKTDKEAKRNREVIVEYAKDLGISEKELKEAFKKGFEV